MKNYDIWKTSPPDDPPCPDCGSSADWCEYHDTCEDCCESQHCDCGCALDDDGDCLECDVFDDPQHAANKPQLWRHGGHWYDFPHAPDDDAGYLVDGEIFTVPDRAVYNKSACGWIAGTAVVHYSTTHSCWLVTFAVPGLGVISVVAVDVRDAFATAENATATYG